MTGSADTANLCRLYLCWEEGDLRWFNPAVGEYLSNLLKR